MQEGKNTQVQNNAEQQRILYFVVCVGIVRTVTHTVNRICVGTADTFSIPSSHKILKTRMPLQKNQ
jgi:hypothetical protein